MGTTRNPSGEAKHRHPQLRDQVERKVEGTGLAMRERHREQDQGQVSDLGKGIGERHRHQGGALAAVEG